MALVLLAAGGGVAIAQTDSPIARESEYLRVRLHKYGVKSITAERLIDDYVTGARPWDSLTGALPVSTVVRRVGNSRVTTYRFRDGSIALSGQQVDTSQREESSRFAPQGIAECEKIDTGGTLYMNNCRISWEAITWSMDFRATYRINHGGTAIASVAGLHYGGVGSLSNARLEIIRSSAPRGSYSLARGSVDQGTELFTRSVGIELRVYFEGGKTSSFG
jgi:hypothetical protein